MTAAPKVSVVIAAHGRPEPLNLALRALRRQSEEAWEAWVVADACTPAMLAGIEADDPRIHVLPLARRCGHQYGPNSVGLRAARGTHVAFLNHDDLWLPDHLALALEGLASQGADFWFARAAFCHHAGQHDWQARLGRLAFSEHNAPAALWRCLDGPNALFEPASAWVVDAALARRVGPWRPPGSAARTPVMDWVAEAARHGARFAFGTRTSVLKLNLHHPPHVDVPTYALHDPLEAFVPALVDADPEALRAQVDADVAASPSRPGLLVRDILRVPPRADDPAEADRLARFEHLRTARRYPEPDDPAACATIRAAALESVAIRTGERLAGFPPVDALWPEDEALPHG